MKSSNKIIIGLIAAVALLGLYPIYMFKASFNGEPLPENTVTGNGDLKKETLSLSDFEEIEIIHDFDVILKQGDFKVETEMDSNLEEFSEIEVDGDRLRLKWKKGTSTRYTQTPKVYVTMPELRRAIVFSSGSLKNEGVFEGDHIEMEILGSGDMDLNFECETIKASIMGSGEIDLDGKGQFLEISLPGSGEVNAMDFSTTNANIQIAGSGEARVNTSEHLEVSISGSGSVSYTGEPENINKHISGSGDVTSI